MRKNTSGFCGQQPSLIILKRNTTPPQTWVEDPLFCCSVWRKKNGKRKEGGKKANHALFQSVQSALVNFSVQRFNVSNEHQTSTVTCGGLIVVCTFPCHISEERTFHYTVVSYITLHPQAVLFLEINLQNNSQHTLWQVICNSGLKVLQHCAGIPEQGCLRLENKMSMENF